MTEPTVQEQLAEINRKLDVLIRERTVQDFYTVGQFAERVGKAEFTVREWARLGRIRATKRQCGRGRSKDWSISHAELTRYRSDGLLPQFGASER